MTRTSYDIQNEIVYCTRCGIGQSAEQVYKRKIRNAVNAEWCVDCRDNRPQFKSEYKWIHPILGRIYCLLWLHELDDDWNPIDEHGQLFRPGKRLCGLKDCVRSAHLIPAESDAKVSGKIKSEASPPIRLTPQNR